MQHNDLEMLAYQITCGLQDFINLVVASKQIDKYTREYLIMHEAIDIVDKLAGFKKENDHGR